MRQRALSPGALVAAIASVLALGLYLLWLAPTVGQGDTAELTTATVTLGVPHPTGYPLYLLVGHGFSTLFAVGDPAWRLNVLNAGFAALAVGGVAACAWRLGRSWVGAAVAAACFLSFPAVLEASLTNEVYALHALLQGAILLAWLGWIGRDGGRGPWPIALLIGLGFTHHLMTVLVAPWVVLAVLWWGRARLSPRGLLAAVAAGLGPLLLYAALPLISATAPAIDWGHVRDLRLFLLHVTGSSFHDIVQPTQAAGASSLHALWEAGGIQTIAAIALALVGLAALRARPRLALPLGAALLTALLFALSYQVVDQATFFIPALHLTAILAGVGAAAATGWLEANAPRSGTAVGALLVVLMVASPTGLRGSDAADRSVAAHDEAWALLEAAPADALLYTHGPTGFVPLYPLEALGLRPDMALVDSSLMIKGHYPEALEQLRGKPLPPGIDPQLITARTAVGTGRPVVLLPTTPDLEWGVVGLTRTRRGAYDTLGVRLGEPSTGEAPSGPMPELVEARLSTNAARRGGVTILERRWAIPEGSRWAGGTLMIALASDQGVLLNDAGQPVAASFHGLSALYAGEEQLEDRVALRIPRDAPPGRWRWFLALRGPEGWQPIEAPDPATLEFEVLDEALELWAPLGQLR